MVDSKQIDGGMAFPGILGPPSEFATGMSLRDHFATNALIGIGTWMPMPDHGIPSLTTEASLRARAEWAYRQADAMIAARKAGS